jgi:hypothetical protein
LRVVAVIVRMLGVGMIGMRMVVWSSHHYLSADISMQLYRKP